MNNGERNGRCENKLNGTSIKLNNIFEILKTHWVAHVAD